MDGAVHVNSSFLAIWDLWSCVAPGFLAHRGEAELSHSWPVCRCGLYSLSTLERMLEGPILGCRGAGR